MGNKIRILDEQTINQIAAGEVIENGASVVKELIDNSIDAGSSHIVIDVQGSGRQAIMVQDTGCGMSHDDALLCLERHATSKIVTEDDLWRIKTMGFRGEALAAISSISHFSLLTGPRGEKSPPNDIVDGTSLIATGGKIKTCQKTRTLAGTKITVSDLFFNVPARRKFLKAPAKEAVDILKTVTLAALSHPHIGFELILNHKKEFSLQPQERSARIKELLGAPYYSELLEVSFANDWLAIQGFVGKPSASKPNRSGQYLFVNSRPVTSLFVSGRVKEAYGSSIDEGRHPAFVLYLELASDRLDCNVHPQKKEVRFAFEEELKQHLIAAITGALFASTRMSARASFPSPMPYEQRSVSLPTQPFQITQSEIVPADTHFQIIGVYGDYILLTLDPAEGLYIVDSRLALAQILHEKLSSIKHGESSQMLLVPLFVELSMQEARQLTLHIEELKAWGFSIRPFGATSFLVEAFPASFEHIDLEEFLRHIASSAEIKLEQAVKKPAFQKSIKSLGAGMAPYIIKKLLACSEPIMTLMTPKELAARFV